MRLKTSTYELRLTLRAPDHVDQQTVYNALHYSSAVDALEDAIWNAITLPEEALDAVDSVFEMKIEVIKGRFDE